MPTQIEPPTEFNLDVAFGGGLHTARPEDQIDPLEAAGGYNFDLDKSSTDLRLRRPFDELGTVPNGGSIRGGITLKKLDGTVFMAIQADDKVYSWDGFTFAEIGTVDVTARLRGRIEHAWELDESVLVTDLEKQEPVLQWDGVTLEEMPNNLDGDFKAKYCFVDKERAFFGNVESNSVDTPHLLIGSLRENNEILSVDDRPSSALSDEDPFYIPSPDLKPINGLVSAFGRTVLGTERGTTFNLIGETAKDFAITKLASTAAARGDESMIFIGDDIVFGRQGKIESVLDTDRFGDVEINDLSRWIADEVVDFESWTAVYNSRIDRAYFFPRDRSQVWVLEKSLLSTPLSPWTRWRTGHPMGFNPTFVMNMLDPQDGLEYVFMGDSTGKLYRLEGSGDQGDGGAYLITLEHISKLFSAPADLQTFDHFGHLRYRKGIPAEVTLTYQYAGVSAFDGEVVIDIQQDLDFPVYTGIDASPNVAYYGGDYYYNEGFEGRLVRQNFGPEGQDNEFQIKTSYTETQAPDINRIINRFEAAN